MEKKKVFLTEDEIPRQWYNINADIKMNPPLGPEGKPVLNRTVTLRDSWAKLQQKG